MRADLRLGAVLLLAVGWSAPATAQKGVPPTAVTVGGYAMISDRTMMENLSQSAESHTFVDLLRLAGMSDMLRQNGPLTVFVPSEGAFDALPTGMLDMLRKSENKAKLVALLSNHIVPGVYSSARLHLMLRTGKGASELDTINDGKLQIGANGPNNVVLRNSTGIVANIKIYDVKQSNGVAFVIDRVVLPG